MNIFFNFSVEMHDLPTYFFHSIWTVHMNEKIFDSRKVEI